MTSSSSKYNRTIDELNPDDSYNVIWEPHPGSQELFLSCPYSEVLYEGTRGPGKTDALLMSFAQHCGQGFGLDWRGILFRRTYPELKDVIHKSIKFFSQIFPMARYNRSDHAWRWPTGETLYFSFMDSPNDYWNYHGHEYPWIGWEELCNWQTNECYEAMKACNRSTNKFAPRKYLSTANPYGVGHGWVKSYFIDPVPPLTLIKDKYGERIRIQGFMWENKALVENDPQYVDRMRRIADPNLRKAWWYGSWDIVAGGAIVDVWNPGIHVIEPFVIPKSWRVDRSFDWGSSKPFSVGWWVESDGTEAETKSNIKKSFPPGTLFRIHEWYGWNGESNKGCKMLSRDIAKGIKGTEERWGFKVEPGPADSTIFYGEDGMSIADKMADEGVEWTEADKSPGSRVAGLERVRQLLMNSLLQPMEDPGLFIFNSCVHFRRTVPVLPRDDKKLDDVDTRAEDHIWDETRYRAMEVRYEEGEVSIIGV